MTTYRVKGVVIHSVEFTTTVCASSRDEALECGRQRVEQAIRFDAASINMGVQLSPCCELAFAQHTMSAEDITPDNEPRGPMGAFDPSLARSGA